MNALLILLHSTTVRPSRTTGGRQDCLPHPLRCGRGVWALAAFLALGAFAQTAPAPPPAAISTPSGPPFGSGRANGGPSAMLADQIFAQADTNQDHKVTKAELVALADAWFDKLDPEKTGAVSQDDFAARFRPLLGMGNLGAFGFGPPQFRPGGGPPGPRRAGPGPSRPPGNSFGPGRPGSPPGRFRGFGGFGGFGFFGNPALPLFLAADVDKDGALTRDELKTSFQNWFDQWDAQKTGALTLDQLRAGLARTLPEQSFPRFGRGGFGRGGSSLDVLQQEIRQGADFSEKPSILPESPEEEQKRFLLPPGYHMELVLSEPVIEEPVAIAFDGDGRMFVAEMRTYMQDITGTGQHQPRSRISMHEDTHGNGVYDRHTVFIDHMVLPRFILPWADHSILAMETDADDIFKYTDANGDGIADLKELFYSGAGRRGNLEHQQSGMIWALDNRMYTTYNAFRLRWTPRGIIRESTAPNGGQWGLTQDNYGKVWFVDAGGERGPLNFQTPIVYGAFNVIDQFEPGFEVPWGAPIGVADMQGGMRRVRLPDGNLNHFTAACGPDIFRGHRLPRDLVGDLLFAEPVARVVRRAKVVVADGLTQLRNAYPKSEFIRSTDPLFRPVNMATAPDGTLYIVDMYRGIIQEGAFIGPYLRKKIEQYQLDKIHSHGRIWRLVYDGIAPDRRQPRMLEETSAQLVKHLEHPNGWWRDAAQKLLVLRQDKSVVPALQNLARTSGNELTRIHALWTLEGLGALDASLVRQTLRDPDPQLRVQALRLSESLYPWSDPAFDSTIRTLARDADPNVAIQSILTLNRLKVPHVEDFIRATISNTNSSRGLREIGAQILQPRPGFGPGGFGGFARFLLPDQRQSFQRGAAIYQELCFACHGFDGKGAPVSGGPSGLTMAPSLARSPRVLGHRDYAINVILYGLEGRVEGRTYTAEMVPMGSNTDRWVADVASYIRNSFGNSAPFITPEEVAAVRHGSGRRQSKWNIDELVAATPKALRYQPSWKLAASENSAMAGYAINGAGMIRWDTGAPQRPGMWFQIELPQPAALTEIEMIAPNAFPPGAPADFPRQYEVQISRDGHDWGAPIAEGKGNGPATVITFAPVSAKFIRIVQSGNEANAPAWSIQKLLLYQLRRPPIREARAAAK